MIIRLRDGESRLVTTACPFAAAMRRQTQSAVQSFPDELFCRDPSDNWLDAMVGEAAQRVDLQSPGWSEVV
ncbi:hypothetical protein J5X84_38330 [Streptosporangiaceae bacterium NEAU-GS5]|nr:hypothetical protein [Streptosporangiaceae bacterium NEAU-GS5]